jgi:proline iminopeptidase
MAKVFRGLLLLVFLLCHSALYAQRNYITMSDGTRIFYNIQGNGKDTLIYLHGGPGSNSLSSGPDILRLARNHVLIIYDQRGCGFSDQGDTSKLTPSTYIKDLEEIRNFFHLNNVIIFGHSWGCGLATLYTSQYPTHVKRLLLIAPISPTRKLLTQRFATFAKKDSVGQARTWQLRAQMDTSTNPAAFCNEITNIALRLYFYDQSKISEKKGTPCAIPKEAFVKQAVTLRRMLQALGEYDFIPLIEQLKQPVLIIEGAQTPVPLEELHIWAKALSNGRLLLVEKAGHAYSFTEQPQIFFPAVERFLKGRWPEKAVDYHNKKH